MISTEETTGAPAPETHDASLAPLPASTRVYVQGELFPQIRVPMREISLSDTKSFNGRIEKNESVRVYDCSGPWGDPDFKGTSEEGLPALRRDWILARGDVEAYDGREVQPQDNGYLTEKHVEFASKSERANKFIEFPGLTADRRQPLRATGKPVTQKYYADQGIITAEMEYIAIRENMRRAKIADMKDDIVRNHLDKQHAGSVQSDGSDKFVPSIFRMFPQRIPAEITPEFVRSEVAAGRAIIPLN
ncbi:MAG: phosphomethylpyrimidine synthase, partial [Verrucomicrobiota bacterium]